jgi:hypothetical protein
MLYGLLADLIGVVHFGYVSFVVFGQLLILIGIFRRWHWIRNMKFRVLHLVMIGVVALESMGELMCPLTTWEKSLRVLAGQPASGDSFVADLLNRVMFFDCVPFNHWIFKSSYVSFAALVVMTFVVAPPRRRTPSPGNLEVDRGRFATALLATLAFICLYTAWCAEDYKREADAWEQELAQRSARFPGEHAPDGRPEDRQIVWFFALVGVHFLGLSILCWGAYPRAQLPLGPQEFVSFNPPTHTP